MNRRRAVSATALCGILAALAVCFLFLGGVLPFAGLCAALLASICVLVCESRAGGKAALLVFGISAFLALLLCPDTESAALYAGFFGWYPVFRQFLHRRLCSRPRLRVVLKVLVYTASVTAVYALLLLVFSLPALREEFAAYSAGWLLALYLLSLLCFLLCDRVLGMIRVKLLLGKR